MTNLLYTSGTLLVAGQIIMMVRLINHSESRLPSNRLLPPSPFFTRQSPSLKYVHIYVPVLFVLWLGLFIDGAYVAGLFENSQWLTNILVFFAFIYVYRQVSYKVKKLMRYGLVISFFGELLFAIVLGMYSYRLANLPLYVPFGHTLVYAAVYYMVKEPLIKNNALKITNFLTPLIFGYALFWLILAQDVFGFLCTLLVLYLFKKRPHSQLFFSIMFWLIVYLEIIGTYNHCWVWPAIWFDQISLIPSANPPSGISIFYFAFDAGCLWFYRKLNGPTWHKLINIRQLRRDHS